MLVDGFAVDGFRRSYRLHVPARHTNDEPKALVLALHGGVSNSKIFESQSGLSELADREGFLVAYPNGIGVGPFLRHWNGGYCCARALKQGVDDMAFLDAVVEDVAGRFPVDRGRLYVVGYSNGGMLAYLYAAQRPRAVAAIGIFASSPGLQENGKPTWLPELSGPMPLIHIHGFEDERLRWRKKAKPRRRGSQATTLDPLEAATYWAASNGCDEPPEETTLLDGAVSRWRWCPGSPAPVVLYGLERWGHEWPGHKRTRRKRSGLRGFDAATEMWQFLRGFERR